MIERLQQVYHLLDRPKQPLGYEPCQLFCNFARPTGPKEHIVQKCVHKVWLSGRGRLLCLLPKLQPLLARLMTVPRLKRRGVRSLETQIDSVPHRSPLKYS